MAEAARAAQEAQNQAKMAELQLKAQTEQAKLQAQTQIKGMEVQAKVAGQMMPQGVPPGTPQGLPDIASRLDQIRQIVPELAQASDEQIMQILARLQIPQIA
jgi:hypothetical protein